MTNAEAVAAVDRGERAIVEMSLHAKESDTICRAGEHKWRVIVCDGASDRDVDECVTCGRQITTRCSFDEEYS